MSPYSALLPSDLFSTRQSERSFENIIQPVVAAGQNPAMVPMICPTGLSVVVSCFFPHFSFTSLLLVPRMCPLGPHQMAFVLALLLKCSSPDIYSGPFLPSTKSCKPSLLRDAHLDHPSPCWTCLSLHRLSQCPLSCSSLSFPQCGASSNMVHRLLPVLLLRLWPIALSPTDRRSAP